MVVAMMTSPMPSPCRWKSRSAASNLTSSSSMTSSSTSRTPTRPWVAGLAWITARAQRVDEIAGGEEPAHAQEHVEDGARPSLADGGCRQGAREEHDGTQPLGVGVEEREPGLGDVHSAGDDLAVVLGGAGESVDRGVGGDPGTGVGVELRA